MSKIEFVNWVREEITYKHKGQWYRVPFFVLELYSNDFFLEEWNYDPQRNAQDGKAHKLRQLLDGQFNDHNQELPFNYTIAEVVAGKYDHVLEGNRNIILFKELFQDQLDDEFTAYQLYGYE